MNKRKTGSIYERLAASYLNKHEITIIGRNVKSFRGAEIDLIGRDKNGTIIFFEVKYRKSTKAGSPAEAVTNKKMKSISFAADYFRCHMNIADKTPLRFDVIAITGGISAPVIHWYKNAFEYIR